MRAERHWAVRVALAAMMFGWLGMTSGACGHTPTRKDREAARINYDLGITSFEHGDPREAVRVLRVAVERDPSLPEAHHALGLIYHSMGRQQDALRHYRAAVRLRPSFSDAHNNLGVLLLDIARYDEAIAAFETALGDVLYTTPALAQGNLGWAYYKKGDVALAREHIGSAVAQNPQFCRGYEWLLRIALDEGEGAEAVTLGKRFQANCLNNPALATSLTPSYRRQMDYYLAMGHLKVGQTAQAMGLLRGCAATTQPRPGEDSEIVERCRASLGALE